MKCLTCLYYLTETCIKEQIVPDLSEMMLADMEELGFDGYCAELDVYIGEECCCSNYTGKVDV